jgi:hypothetical protein
MPLAQRFTPAKGAARARVLRLLDTLQVHTGQPGRPRKRPKVLAMDKGYETQALR